MSYFVKRVVLMKRQLWRIRLEKHWLSIPVAGGSPVIKSEVNRGAKEAGGGRPAYCLTNDFETGDYSLFSEYLTFHTFNEQRQKLLTSKDAFVVLPVGR
jgi:predicted Rossmann-fold nucleotide-binding protein